jgi:electron transfer flavoprotein alpha subunit
MKGRISVWAYSENNDLLLELLACGRALSNTLKIELTAVLIGNKVESQADKVVQYGADNVFTINYPAIKESPDETCRVTLTDLIATHKPEILLIGSTKNGKELASRIAAKLETGCINDCSYLTINGEGQLVTKRVVYSGNAVVTAKFCKSPQIATVPFRTFEKLEPTERKGNIVKHDVKVVASRVEVTGVNKMEVSDVKVEEARIVVCGGRGIDKKEDFTPLKELAQVLEGQVSNSRPLAEDRKWFSGWVGLSGKKIKPTVYIGCGISGMIQHVAGMRDSQIVVAINKDPEAAIFEVADYVVVGDLNEIVPAIVKEFKKILN